MAQVAVTVLEVHEVEAGLLRQHGGRARSRRSGRRSRRRSDRVVGQPMPNLRSSSGWWYRISAPALSCRSGGQSGRNGSAAGRPAGRRSRPEALAVGLDQHVAQPARSRQCVQLIISWLGLARPSCRTATASPPQISLAPLSPKCCQRRAVRSDGPAVRRAVPAFHRQDAEAVADRKRSTLIGLRQRRVWRGQHLGRPSGRSMPSCRAAWARNASWRSSAMRSFMWIVHGQAVNGSSGVRSLSCVVRSYCRISVSSQSRAGESRRPR